MLCSLLPRSLLALSAVCPGASTLIGNLLKSSAVRPLESMQRTLAGRQWLRAYVNGCAYQVGREWDDATRGWPRLALQAAGAVHPLCLPLAAPSTEMQQRLLCNPHPLQFLHVAVPQHLVGRRFTDVALWLFVNAGKVLIGGCAAAAAH